MVFENGNLKIAITYVVLQVIIWIKCTAFYLLYGAGRVASFNSFLFPTDAIGFNFFFHEAMHIAIGVLALLFGKNLKKIEWFKLVAVVFVAVFIHNIAYWLSFSHESLAYSAFDFTSDSVILLTVILVGYVLGKLWTHFKKRKQAKEKI